MKYGQMAYNAGNFKYLSVNSLRLSTDLKGATYRKDFTISCLSGSLSKKYKTRGDKCGAPI
jgi:hypothetical protein